MKKNGFRKSERICSQVLIDELFSKGKELRKFPFIVKFMLTDFVGEAWKLLFLYRSDARKKLLTGTNLNDRLERHGD